MTTLREAAQQAMEALEGGGDSWRLIGPAIDALKAALAEEALQRLSDANQEIEAVLEQPKFTLSCGCPSQHGGILAEWPEITREGDPAVVYGTLCERHWHEYEARCPNCASLEAQNTELDRKLAEVERNA